jgi:hypothetical protein
MTSWRYNAEIDERSLESENRLYDKGNQSSNNSKNKQEYPLPKKKPKMNKCLAEKKKLDNAEQKMNAAQGNLNKVYLDFEKIRSNLLDVQNKFHEAKKDRDRLSKKGAVVGKATGSFLGSRVPFPGAAPAGGFAGGYLGKKAGGYIDDGVSKYVDGEQTVDELQQKVNSIIKKIRDMEVIIKTLYQRKLQQTQSEVKRTYAALERCKT